MEDVILSDLCLITEETIECLSCKKSFDRKPDSTLIMYCKCQSIRLAKTKRVIELLLVNLNENYEVDYN